MKKYVCSLALALLLCVGLAAPASASYDMGKVGEFQTISGNGNVYMAIDSRGVLWSWEYRDRHPARVLENAAAVSRGNDHTAVIKTDGTLWTWGGNASGQLGSNSAVPYSSVPEKVLDDVAAVSAGNEYTMAIKTDGTLWAWGDNSCGQLGNGSRADCFTPVKVMDDVLAVSASPSGILDSWRNTIAVKTDGTLWAWGFNGLSSSSHGVLGFEGGDSEHTSFSDHTTTYYQTVPRQVYGIDHVVAVSNEGRRFMALKSDGTLWSWGLGGELSSPVYLGYQSTNRGYSYNLVHSSSYMHMQTFPKQVMEQVSAACFGESHSGDHFALALKTDGTLWAWGDNGYTDGSISVLGFTGGDVVVSGYFNADMNRVSRCWQSVPREVEQIDDVSEVSGTLVRKSDGTLWQLKEGSFVPVEISDFIVSESGKLEAYVGLDRDVVIPDKVTVIGSSAFSGNTDLTSITIPNSVTRMEAGAFSGCTGLTGVTIPSSVTVMEASVFSGCTGLTDVTIPSGVTAIKSGAFSGCTGLTRVTIPNSVTEISQDAFADCVSLIDVTAPKNSGVTDGVFDQTPYQEKEDARHAMMVTILVVAAVAAVLFAVALSAWKRKKDPEGYARKKQEQERRREEKRAEQAAAEEARAAKLAAEEAAQKEKQAAEEKARRERQAAALARQRIETVLTGTVTCSCGTVNPATAQFCSQCGKPVKVPGRCACGHQNDPEARFCQKCGKPLNEEEDRHEA